MNPELQETYARRIQNLFNGDVQAEPEQITDEVVKIVDTMFNEITTCHRNLAPFAIAAHAIAEALFVFVPDELKVLFGNQSFAEYLSDKTKSPFLEMLKLAKVKSFNDYIEKMQEIWLQYTSGNRAMLVCINKAKLHYRSPLEIALMDI